MKVFRLIGMALITILMCITACSDGDDESETVTQQAFIKTVTLKAAGTLEKLLGDQYLEIEALKIIGSLNGSDIRIIRVMGGGSDNHYATSGKLSYLDLSDASIVEGGDCYYNGDDYYCYTSNNEIGDCMFYDCKQLKTIILPNRANTIGYGAFWGCTELTSVTFGNGVTTIGDGAFWQCTGLTSIIIPNSVTTIGSYAFSECTGLTSITIPNSVTTIGECAFSGCRGLTSVTIPNSVTTIGDGAFSRCNRLTSVTFGNGVTTIEEGAFEFCTGLTSITIPNSVMTIGDRAFSSCTGLTSVTIPNSVNTIGNDAFYKCTGLTSISIPNSVTTIGSDAFYGCNIKKCHIYATTPPETNESFSTVYAESTLYVPKGCVEIYKKAGWGSDFYNIVEMD